MWGPAHRLCGPGTQLLLDVVSKSPSFLPDAFCYNDGKESIKFCISLVNMANSGERQTRDCGKIAVTLMYQTQVLIPPSPSQDGTLIPAEAVSFFPT